MNFLQTIGHVFIGLFIGIGSILGLGHHTLNPIQVNVTATSSLQTQKITPSSSGSNQKTNSVQTVSIPTLPGSTTFTSPNLGISFQYFADSSDPNNATGVKEEGNIVYVYVLSDKPEDGQSVQVFHKDPHQSLQEAIQQQILANYPANCEINTMTASTSYGSYNDPNPTFLSTSNFQIATIENKNTNVNDAPPTMYHSQTQCGQYANLGGFHAATYFLYDTNHPDTFLFFRKEAYPIPADSNGNYNWEDTIRILK